MCAGQRRGERRPALLACGLCPAFWVARIFLAVPGEGFLFESAFHPHIAGTREMTNGAVPKPVRGNRRRWRETGRPPAAFIMDALAQAGRIGKCFSDGN